ncbi:MAG: hypothetical protein ACRDLF_02285 [Solirubrobacteraceae bacterium]
MHQTVHLTAERWEHIIDGHPYMAAHCAEVLRAVREPTERIAQPHPGQDWFYLEGAGPSRWLKVVIAVRWEHRTAFPRRRKT